MECTLLQGENYMNIISNKYNVSALFAKDQAGAEEMLKLAFKYGNPTEREPGILPIGNTYISTKIITLPIEVHQF